MMFTKVHYAIQRDVVRGHGGLAACDISDSHSQVYVYIFE